MPNSTLQSALLDENVEQSTSKFRSLKLNAGVVATAYFLPFPCLNNSQLIQQNQIDTSDAWIVSHTGIKERRYAPSDWETVDLAIQVGQEIIHNSQINPAEIGLIIVATSSHHLRMPSAACLVQQVIHADNATCFDLANSCAGFISAFDQAAMFTHLTGRYSLVIGADCGSRLVDPNDRLTSIFFGDAAGGLMLGSTSTPKILASFSRSAGCAAPLSVPVNGSMKMDGPAIWKFATTVVPELLLTLCEQAEISPQDLDLVIPHQSNLKMLEHIADKVGISREKFAINVERVGNTMAASIPVCLAEYAAKVQLNPGSLVATLGFGAGLSWGGHIFRW
jgi:3-oxoacyl-[acyl-carrier-protein] synthase-3